MKITGTVLPVYCCKCGDYVQAQLVYGRELYPRRPDLANVPFWQCPVCGNYVGTHHKTNNPLVPLGTIPTPDLRRLRNRVHAAFDPIWRSGVIKRNKLYKLVSKRLGYDFHSATINSSTQAYEILELLNQLSIELVESSNGYC